MNETVVRILRPEDISTVVKMLHESFDSRLTPFMTYTQHGIGDFLAVPLEYPDLPSDRTCIVMVRQHDIVGFADFRMLDHHTSHLSYICVKPSARGSGVATALISAFLAWHPLVSVMSLDVFRTNGPAKALYRKLGFKTVQTAAWITRESPDAFGSISIASIEASMAAYRRYGFCQLDVLLEQQHIRVGLIGPHVVRCFSLESFQDDVLLAGLRQVFKLADRAMTAVPEAEIANIDVPYSLATLTDRMRLQMRPTKE